MSDLGFSFSLFQLWQIAGGQIILIVASLALIFIDLKLSADDSPSQVTIMGVLTVMILTAVLLHLIYRQWPLNEIILLDVFSTEKFAVFISCIVLMAGILAALMSIGYMRNNCLVRGEYFIMLIFAVYGAIAMVQSVDLLMMFIA
ncbi:MAG TPA: hypothetical protein EYP57_10090, partial [Thermodesulfobacteriaceae bacterium]|nr:hypothetical protein [Thermodesulfobacteriaceae bacterium]